MIYLLDFGGEKFTLSYDDNYNMIIKDKHNNPLNIFGEYNDPSGQYGGNQMDVSNPNALQDPNINALLEARFPGITPEEKIIQIMLLSIQT